MVTPPPVLNPPQRSSETVGLQEHESHASFESPSRERSRFEGVLAFLVSATIHITLLLILALIVRTNVLESTIVMEFSAVEDDGASASLQVFRLSEADPPLVDPALGDSADEPITYELLTLASVSEVEIPRPEPSAPEVRLPSDAAADREPLNAKTSKKEGVKFFGTHAYGDTFVYVLDVSGSMSSGGGGRMQRARVELIRSINELQPHHSFYVVLYSNTAINMFYESGQARMRPASRDNKKKVARWIHNVRPQGGTLPAEALKIAGDLSPDAVFFLSDGDFVYGDEPGISSAMDRFIRGFGQARPGLLQGHPLGMSRSPKSVLSEYAPEIVVHTIALESEASRRRMELIAESKGGQHRFIRAPQAMNDAPRRRAVRR